MFKQGDKVVNKNGNTFSNGCKVVTVKRVEESTWPETNKVWFEETGTWVYETAIKLETPAPSIFSTKISVKGDFVKGTIADEMLQSSFYGSVMRWDAVSLRLFASELLAVADKIEEGVNK